MGEQGKAATSGSGASYVTRIAEATNAVGTAIDAHQSPAVAIAAARLAFMTTTGLLMAALHASDTISGEAVAHAVEEGAKTAAAALPQ